ncbi:Plasmodium exported protein, unknown function, partial [Plasmodium gonderi]
MYSPHSYTYKVLRQVSYMYSPHSHTYKVLPQHLHSFHIYIYISTHTYIHTHIYTRVFRRGSPSSSLAGLWIYYWGKMDIRKQRKDVKSTLLERITRAFGHCKVRNLHNNSSIMCSDISICVPSCASEIDISRESSNWYEEIFRNPLNIFYITSTATRKIKIIVPAIRELASSSAKEDPKVIFVSYKMEHCENRSENSVLHTLSSIFYFLFIFFSNIFNMERIKKLFFALVNMLNIWKFVKKLWKGANRNDLRNSTAQNEREADIKAAAQAETGVVLEKYGLKVVEYSENSTTCESDWIENYPENTFT